MVVELIRWLIVCMVKLKVMNLIIGFRFVKVVLVVILVKLCLVIGVLIMWWVLNLFKRFCEIL